MKYINVSVPILLLLFLGGCKKVDELPRPPKPVGPVAERTEAQQILDDVYYYYKQQSYWTESIKDYDPISTFTDQYKTADDVLAALKAQTPYHAGYKGPIDRFSWIQDISSGSEAFAKKADRADGYGIYLTWARIGGNVYLYPYFVEAGSPAQLADVRRGDRILSINGNTDMSQNNISFIETALEKPTLSLKVLREGKEILFPDLKYTNYDINPVIGDTVYTRNGKNYGYLALSSFEELEDDFGNKTQMYKDLESAFDRFATHNVSDLIIDLRVNTGGYVSSAIYFANKIINSTGNKKIMFSYDVNKNLEYKKTGAGAEFANVMFEKRNSLEVKKVVFLVSEMTASAAEIVISVLKPYMDVKLVSDIDSPKDATYGKPVGFYREDIKNKIGLWAASFKIINAKGYSDYWDGIPADIKDVIDNITLDFGDSKENMIAAGLNYLTTGSLSASISGEKATTRSSSASGMRLQRITPLKERPLIKK